MKAKTITIVIEKLIPDDFIYPQSPLPEGYWKNWLSKIVAECDLDGVPPSDPPPSD